MSIKMNKLIQEYKFAWLYNLSVVAKLKNKEKKTNLPDLNFNYFRFESNQVIRSLFLYNFSSTKFVS